MSQENLWRGILSNACQGCRVNFPSTEFNTLSGDVAALVEGWVQENLVGSKLLTADEISLYKSLKGSKHQTTIYHDPTNDSQLPLNEHALLSAARELELETQKLRSKSHAIRKQVQHVGNSGVTGYQFISALLNREEIEKQQALFMNGQAVKELQETTQKIDRNIEKGSRAASSSVSEKLKADDRALESLHIPASVTGLDAPRSNLHDQSMLNALQQATVLSLKSRLDRCYLEELMTPEPHIPEDQGASAIEQARKDLRLLYVEIEDVAAMAVDHQYGKEMRTLESKLKMLSDESASRSMLKILAKLEHLTQSTRQLTNHYHHLLAHQRMVMEVQAHYAQAQTQIDLGEILEDGEHLPDKIGKIDDLLRHLDLSDDNGAETDPFTRQLHKSAKSKANRVQSAIAHIMGAVRSGVKQSQEQSQGLLAISDRSLAQAVQQNRAFDHRVAFTKAHFETSSKLVDLDVDAHGRSIAGSRHA